MKYHKRGAPLFHFTLNRNTVDAEEQFNAFICLEGGWWCWSARGGPQIADADTWDDTTFLNKAKLCLNGKITRTALLLLGKPESTHHLSPSQARITWVLKDEPLFLQAYPMNLAETASTFAEAVLAESRLKTAGSNGEADVD